MNQMSQSISFLFPFLKYFISETLGTIFSSYNDVWAPCIHESIKARLVCLQCTEDSLVWELLRQLAWEYSQDVRQVSGASFIMCNMCVPITCLWVYWISIFCVCAESSQIVYSNEAKYKVVPLEVKNKAQMDQMIVLQSNDFEKTMDILLDKQETFIS